VPSEFLILTERTRLRRLTPADLADFQHYRSDEEVGLYQDWTPQSDTDAAIFLEQKGTAEFFQPGTWFQLGIADRQTDRLIGDIGICLSADESEVEIGFSLCRQSQGLGLASEAVKAAVAFIFKETDIPQIIGITDTRNIASLRLLEKLGMQRLQTDTALFRGSPCEEHLYALHRPQT